jgi:cyanate permease
VLFGAASGALFALCLTLPLDVARHPGEVASVAAMMLLGGYLISALGPLVLGAVRDITGSFQVGIALLIVSACGVMLRRCDSRRTASRAAPSASRPRPAEPAGGACGRFADRSGLSA